MREFKNIESFVEHLTATIIAEELAAKHAVSKCAKIVEKCAKRKIGEYQEQAGPFIAWQELADSTKADRARKGFPENDPLLRTGEMRESIGHAVSIDGMEAQIGSNSEIAVFQEVGTSRMPSRSFLGGAMADKLPEIKEIIGAALVGALIGKNVTAALLGEEVVQGGIEIGK
jgi:HK97 gp10 family phage protein